MGWENFLVCLHFLICFEALQCAEMSDESHFQNSRDEKHRFELPGFHIDFWENIIQHMSAIHFRLMENYSSSIQPFSVVDFDYQLSQLNDFNEITGQLQTIGNIFVKWSDPRLVWDVNNYSVSDSVTFANYTFNFTFPTSFTYFKIRDLWRPDIMLKNPVSRMFLFDRRHQDSSVHVDHGWVTFTSSELFTTTCDPDVKYFPFDEHECTLEFMSTSKLNLTNFYSRNKSIFCDDTKWIYYQMQPCSKSTSDDLDLRERGIKEVLMFPIVIVRRPLYALINIMMPLLILSYLNIIVYFTPPNSSERITFCITLLLSFTVYLLYISDIVPETSNPVPLVIFYLLFKLSFSCLVALSSFVFSLLKKKSKYHYAIPKCFQITCQICKKKKSAQLKKKSAFYRHTGSIVQKREAQCCSVRSQFKGIDENGSKLNFNDSEQIENLNTTYFKDDTFDDETEEEDDDFNWGDVCRALDRTCFIFAFVIVVIETCVLIYMMASLTRNVEKKVISETCT